MPTERRFHPLFLGFIYIMLAGYFVWNGAWYAPAILEINGTLTSMPTGFDVAWNSGSGLNGYERYKAVLRTSAKLPESTIQVSYTGKEHGASLSRRIFCRGVFVDGQKLPGSTVKLNRKNSVLTFNVAATKSIAVELATNNHSGVARITINGKSFEENLYVANIEAKKRLYEFWLVDDRNRFSVQADLPRYHIDELDLIKRRDGKPLRVESINLLVGNNSPIPLLSDPQMLSDLKLEDISKYQKRYFDGGRFALQLLFAALAIWLISAVSRLYRFCGGLQEIIRGRQRVFVLFFTGAIFCYLFWLLIFWPGVMSVDSLKIWRAAQLPEVYLNDHPILNVFLYMFLYHIWNNPAVVPLFHITTTSLLVASIFYTVYRNNVPLLVLLPCYLLTVLSIPVGLYNTALWKDIPFALLIVFWGFISALLFHKKQSRNINLSREQVIALFLMLLALGFIRHNGIIYVVFIPLLLILLGVIRLDRRIWGGILAVGLLIGAGAWLVNIIVVSDSGYLIAQGSVYLEDLVGNSPAELLQRSWQNYWEILNINQTASKWDLYHAFLGDRYAYGFLNHAGWNDVFPYVQRWTGPLAFLKDAAMNIYWASYEVPLVYLSWNPVWALVLFPLSIILCRWLPLSAIFSSVVIVQILTLSTLLNIMNWRYFYFACVAGCFVLPMICFDIGRKKKRNGNEVQCNHSQL